MNRFWGRSGDAQLQKFSRDDEQLLALNYENLCDGEYLNRLFTEDSNGSHSTSSNQSTNGNTGWLISPDIAEDMIMFGNEFNLGFRFLEKKNLLKLSSVAIRQQDTQSTLIYRQVAVFERIGFIIKSRWQLAQTLPSSDSIAAVSLASDLTFSRAVGHDALMCTLKVLEKLSRTNLKLSALESLLGLVLNVFRQNPDAAEQEQIPLMAEPTPKLQIDIYVVYLRKILTNGVLQGLLAAVPAPADDVGNFLNFLEEQLQLASCCGYGLLSIGLLLKNPWDILVATTQLYAIDLKLKEYESYVNSELNGRLSDYFVNAATPLPLDIQEEALESTNTGSPAVPIPLIANSPLNLKQKIKIKTEANPTNGTAGNGKVSKVLPVQSQGIAATSSNNNSATAFFPASEDTVNSKKQWEKGPLKIGSDKVLDKTKLPLGKSKLPVPLYELSPSGIMEQTDAIANNNNNITAMTAHMSKIGGAQPANSGGIKVSPASRNNNNNNNNGSNNNNNNNNNKNSKTVSGGIPSNNNTSNNPLKKVPLMSNTTGRKKGSVDSKLSTDTPGSSDSLSLNQKPSSSGTVGLGPSGSKPSITSNTPAAHQELQMSRNHHGGMEMRKKFEKDFKLTVQQLNRVPKAVLRIMFDSKGKDSNPQANLHASAKNTPSDCKITQRLTSTSSYVWTCGQNSYGELGHTDVTLRKTFVQVSVLDNKHVIGVGAGNEHTVFLTAQGKLLVCGYNDNGQCGVGSTQQVKVPTHLRGVLEGEDIAQVHVYNGCEHTLAITRDGKMFSFGYNYRGQLGLGTTASESSPRPVKVLLSRKVILASCSYHHSYFLCSDGSIYSCGRNDCGQLAHGDTIDKKNPQIVMNSPKDVTSMSCGQFHSVIGTGNGGIFVCGKNDYGQLGLDNPDNVKVFTQLKLGMEVDTVVQVCCGYYHTLLLSHSGLITGFGRNDYGQLGLGHVQPRVFACSSVLTLRDKNAVSLSAGCYHSIVVTANGMLYVFGRNNHGQLGTGDTDERHLPHPIDDFVGRRILTVAAGFYHTVVVVSTACADDAIEDAILSTNFSLGHQAEVSAEAAVAKSPKEVDNSIVAHLAALSQISASSNATSPNKQQSQHSHRNFNLQNKTKSSLKELLSYLVNNFDNLVLARLTPMSTGSSFSQGDKSEPVKVPVPVTAPITPDSLVCCVRVMESIALLLEISRSVREDNGRNSDSAVSNHEALAIVKTLICTAGRLLGQYRKVIRDCWSEGGASAHLEDISIMSIHYLLTRPPTRNLNATTIVAELHNITEINWKSCVVDNNDPAPSDRLKLSLRIALSKLRQEIFYIFGHLPSNLSFGHGVRGADISDNAAMCITRCYDVFFPTTIHIAHLYKLFSYYLTSNLTMASQMFQSDDLRSQMPDISVFDTSRCLKLATRLCFKYRSIAEVVKLFALSVTHGIQLFFQLLSIYNHLSLLYLECKASGQFQSLGWVADMNRAIGAFEHCTSNFVKASIPVILTLEPNKLDQTDKNYAHGVALIASILDAADRIISYLSCQPMTDDVVTILRNCTVLPSILPTLLIYGISQATPTCCLHELTPKLQRLMQCLQGISRNVDVDYDVRYSSDQGNEGIRKLFMANKSLHANEIRKLTTLQPLNTVLENMEYQSKIFAQIKNSSAQEVQPSPPPTAWHNRLLKLTVILNSKLASIYIKKYLPAQPSNAQSNISCESIVDHKLWEYLAINSNISNPKLLTLPWSGSVDCSISNLTLDMTRVLRTETIRVDSTYRMLHQAMKAVGTAAYMEAIEDIVFDAALKVQVGCSPWYNLSVGGQYVHHMGASWKSIVTFTNHILSMRSQLVSSNTSKLEGHMTWASILETIRCLVMSWEIVITDSSTSLIRSNSRAKSRVVKKSVLRLRKCIRVVMCAMRWQLSVARKYSNAGVVVVNFMTNAVALVTNNYQTTGLDFMKPAWTSMISHLVEESESVCRLVTGTRHVERILSTSTCVVMKSDCISLLTSAWCSRLDQDIMNSPCPTTSANNCNLSRCCTSETFAMQSYALAALIRSLSNVVLEFMVTFDGRSALATQQDLNLLSQAIHFLHVVAMRDNRRNKAMHMPVSMTVLQKLVNLLEDKIQTDCFFESGGLLQSQGIDDKSLLAKKPNGINARDRTKAQKAATNAAIMMIQDLALREIIDCDGASLDSHDHMLLQQGAESSLAVQYSLCDHLQKARLVALYGQADIDAKECFAGAGANKTSGGVVGAAGGMLASAIAAVSSSAAQKLVNKDAANASLAAKRRYQDVITKTMEFSRISEGFVVQGEKLISNYKGVDFTLSTWIQLTKKNLVEKTSFITGKVSHNDAWPLVVLKNDDSKLVIVYGHSNEFERFTSQTPISIMVWTHIAVVVDQKKIKLFINGVLDSQVTTGKGNARAVLYALLVGSCPMSIRTRVDQVREGFDGMLSQYKYYTRALNPVHVKAVYEQGPPESCDLRERWIYQLLSSIKVSGNNSSSWSLRKLGSAATLFKQIAETIQLVIVTDATSRMRCGAIELFGQLLAVDVEEQLTDFNLSTNTGFAIGKHKNLVPVTKCSFLNEFHNFRDRLILYWIRLIGSCWSPHLTAAANSSDDGLSFAACGYSDLIPPLPTESHGEYSRFCEFLAYAPSFLTEKSAQQHCSLGSLVTPGPNSSNAFSVGEKSMTREELTGELSFHLIRLISSLCGSNVPNSSAHSWSDSVSGVIQVILSSRGKANAAELTSKGDVTSLTRIDMLGVAILLGGMSRGAYIGSEVVGFYGDSICRVLNTNKSTSLATVMTWNASGKRQLSIVRLCDMAMSALNVTSAPALNSAVFLSVLNTMTIYKEYIKLMLHDMFSVYHPESSFIRNIYSRQLRPTESLIYHQLLSYVLQNINQGNCGLLLEGRHETLFKLIQQSAVRMLRLQHGIAHEENPASPDLGKEFTVTDLWGAACPYLSGLSDKCTVVEFAISEHEKGFNEYFCKNLGIAAESYQYSLQDKLVKQGLLTELIQCMSVTPVQQTASLTSPASQFVANYCLQSDGKFYINEPALKMPLLSSAENEFDSISSTLKLMYHIRRNTIIVSRMLLQKAFSLDINLFTSLSAPWNVLVWQSMTYVPALTQHEHMPMIQSSTMMEQACQWLHESRQLEATNSIVSCLRYCAISLFNESANKTAEATDLFRRFVQSAHLWMRHFENDEFESELCFHVLRNLLPSLSFVETNEIELEIMQLCLVALRRLNFHTLRNKEPTKDLLELVKSNNFTLLRARAQDQLMRQKGSLKFNFSPVAYCLTQLSSNLELIQRNGSNPTGTSLSTRALFRSPSKFAIMTPLKSSPAPTALEFLTAPPRVLGIRSTSIDADLYVCLASATDFITNLNSTLQAQADAQMVSPRRPAVASPDQPVCKPITKMTVENATLEVAMGVVAEGDMIIYETVFCGSSSRFVQSGLTPNCGYAMKCRVVIGSYNMDWSPPLEFTTEPGVSFLFDPLRCGADVIISDDGLTASYSGDDCWSTVLGNHAYSSGVTTWEIRITQSPTAYVFVGVATSAADLNTFLGGCGNGWGFIGEQALYHNREKVKIYGEPFAAGDIIGVCLDFNVGTLSFSKNGKSFGVAFDKIYGELFPAVAFYNVGQELEILPEHFRTTCPEEPIPCSTTALNMSDIAMLTELVFCMNTKSMLSYRLLTALSAHANDWCSGNISRLQTASGKHIFVNKKSLLLDRYGLVVGERIRSPLGVAEVVGVAYDRVWFRISDASVIWYFSQRQITSGRERGCFQKCSYLSKPQFGEKTFPSLNPDTSKHSVLKSTPETPDTTTLQQNFNFEPNSLQELLDQSKWSEEMDAVLIAFLQSQGEIHEVSPWNVSINHVFDGYRILQQQLSKIVMHSVGLSHRWGISGPKRKAVVARLAMLRYFNHMLDQYLAVFLNDTRISTMEAASSLQDTAAVNVEFGDRKITDDYQPMCISLDSSSSLGAHGANDMAYNSTRFHLELCGGEGRLSPPVAISTSWNSASVEKMPDCYNGRVSLANVRQRIFSCLKMTHLWDVVSRSAARPAKTDDDYDYPEDLPQIHINRLKSFRAREAAELMGISGEDLVMSSMFCQLWHELRRYPQERLRISYTHPMDDGQSRTFKIKFDGEGVDDYGGPYREIMQQICDELQSPDPSLANGRLKRPSSWKYATGGSDTATATPAALDSVTDEERLSTEEPVSSDDDSTTRPANCFIPLLFPTPNWQAAHCKDRYRYIFHPASLSPLRMDLFRFLGQMVGIGLRSKITMDLSLASVIWKRVVRETLTESDIASFDQPAAEFVAHLGQIYQRLTGSDRDDDKTIAAVTAEAEVLLEDVTWTATRSDGLVMELVPGGAHKSVAIADIGKFLDLYVTARLSESFAATELFRDGLLSVIPENCISFLCWEELEKLVAGTRTIDIERLKNNTEYDDDIGPEDAHIVSFWEVLHGFSEEEKSAFLRFVWARPTLPPKDVEFHQKFKIQSAVGDDSSLKPDDYLPRAHTCFFSMNLPKYSSKEIIAEKLKYAITNCTEMDADFRLTDVAIVGWGGAVPSVQNFNN